MSEKAADTQTPLTSAEIKQINDILSNTPMVALPRGGFQRVKHVGEVIGHLESIVAYLKFTMRELENTKDELTALERDLAAVGRVFERIRPATEPSASEVLKAVRAAVLIRHKFDAEDVQQIAEAHGVKL